MKDRSENVRNKKAISTHLRKKRGSHKPKDVYIDKERQLIQIPTILVDDNFAINSNSNRFSR